MDVSMKHTLSACTLLLAATPFVFAQGPASSPQDGPGQPPPMVRQHPMHDDFPGPGFGGPDGKMGPGGDLHIMPLGMWWKRPEIVTALALTTDQQKRIDELFLKARIDLIHAHATLQEDTLLLEPILNANPFDQAKAVAQIDRIADTRAALEKTDGHMLLSIRAVLTPDQWTKLQAQRGPGRGDQGRGAGGPGRGGGPSGSGDPNDRQH
jgi:Spy/CpxP family protein refolding chaperone